MSRHSEDGRRYRILRRAYLEANPVCWICGHGGSNQIDHDPPRAQHKAKLDQSTWRPAHGNGMGRCPTCGRACNQERGTKPIEAMPIAYKPVMPW
jgi:hypothetical protein